MDLDAYSAAHRDEWNELARLGSTRRLTGTDADSLIDHYQSGATQLSAIKTSVGQSAQAERLSVLLSRARLRFTGVGRNAASQLPTFFSLHLPAALYSIRWLTLAIALASALVATLYGVWAVSTPGVLAAIGSDAEKSAYVKDFVDYYSKYPSGAFAGQVWSNNALIAAQTIAFGVTGVFGPYVLFSNAQNLGLSSAVLGSQGHLSTFFLYIAPHGQLELYSIFVAGAAGLGVFWALIAPGPRTRADALAQRGRALFTIVIGLAGSLLVSGVIEGFVTKQPWPWPVKIGIGTVALAAFLVYQWVVGRRAARAGATGDLDEFEAGARRIVAG